MHNSCLLQQLTITLAKIIFKDVFSIMHLRRADWLHHIKKTT